MACAATAFLAVTSAAVANPAAPYPSMAPIGAYLIDRTQEIALAKSAAPNSISKDATILVLTRTGYETAVTGTNGFVCMVGRSFSGASDWPERWNPKIRAAECLNPPAARSVAPFAKLLHRHVPRRPDHRRNHRPYQNRLRTKEIPPLESGAMSYMMSKSSYLTDQVHDMPHLMFFVAVKNATDWGANAPDTPVIGGNYWFFTPGHEAEIANLPPMFVFLTGVATGRTARPPRRTRCRRLPPTPSALWLLLHVRVLKETPAAHDNIAGMEAGWNESIDWLVSQIGANGCPPHAPSRPSSSFPGNRIAAQSDHSVYTPHVRAALP